MGHADGLSPSGARTSSYIDLIRVRLQNIWDWHLQRWNKRNKISTHLVNMVTCSRWHIEMHLKELFSSVLSNTVIWINHNILHSHGRHVRRSVTCWFLYYCWVHILTAVMPHVSLRLPPMSVRVMAAYDSASPTHLNTMSKHGGMWQTTCSLWKKISFFGFKFIQVYFQMPNWQLVNYWFWVGNSFEQLTGHFLNKML